MKKEEYLEFLNNNDEKFSKIAVIGILHEIANNYKIDFLLFDIDIIFKKYKE